MNLEVDGANFNLYDIPVPSAQGGALVPNTSLPEGQDIGMNPVDEEPRLATTPDFCPPLLPPLAPQPVSPMAISPTLPQRPPSRPVSLALSFMASPPAILPPSQPISPTPSHLASLPGFVLLPLPGPISPLPRHTQSVLPPSFSVLPNRRHMSPPVQPTSPLHRHARPISPAPVVILPLSIFTKKRKNAHVSDNPSKRVQNSTQNESNAAR